MFLQYCIKMEPQNKFMLLFISFYLVVSCSSARPQFSPTVSPSLQPDQSSEESAPVPLAGPAFVPSSSPESASVLSPSPGPASVSSSSPESPSVPSPFTGQASAPSVSPSPSTDSPNYVSFPPSISDSPSYSMSPDADGPSESNGPSSFDISTVLSSVKPSESDGPSPFDISKLFSSVKVDPEVEKICESTDHPALCIATVAPLLKGENIDVKSVLEVAIKASSTFTQFVLSLAKKLAEKPGTPPEMKSILNDCKDSYDTALSNFEETTTALSQGDIGTMNSMLSAVMTFVGDCEDSFDGLGIESPLMDYSDKLTNMTSNCLAIVSLMN
ncbi:uncharacterized protein [Primulina huaijiensis]|uniref:uncharacterized protein n=1 Tax=Primulina huaijiensis TaxID=1492673 RepID=UPI003CC6F9BD